MGNLYEVLASLKSGQTMKSDFPTDITKKGDTLYFTRDGETLLTWGYEGVVASIGQLEPYNWKVVEVYVKIDLDEVARRLQHRLPVYVDNGKNMIEKYTELNDECINDFEDVFLLTKYFKKTTER